MCVSEKSCLFRIKRRYNPEDRVHNAHIILNFYSNVSTYLLIQVLFSYYNSSEQVSALIMLLSIILEVQGLSLNWNINANNRVFMVLLSSFKYLKLGYDSFLEQPFQFSY
jgi:hypothetical protein